jgi:hypothetical protein
MRGAWSGHERLLRRSCSVVGAGYERDGKVSGARVLKVRQPPEREEEIPKDPRQLLCILELLPCVLRTWSARCKCWQRSGWDGGRRIGKPIADPPISDWSITFYQDTARLVHEAVKLYNVLHVHDVRYVNNLDTHSRNPHHFVVQIHYNHNLLLRSCLSSFLNNM